MGGLGEGGGHSSKIRINYVISLEWELIRTYTQTKPGLAERQREAEKDRRIQKECQINFCLATRVSKRLCFDEVSHLNMYRVPSHQSKVALYQSEEIVIE